MKQVMQEIRKKYLVDGENERYATLYESKEEVLDEIDREVFEETFAVNIDEVKFPVITFDNSNAIDGWIFEAEADKEEILRQADDYFKKK